MSYILDALRRADAERDRGAVPGLQSDTGSVADDGEPARGAPAWRWPAAGVAVVLIGAAGWWLGAGSARPEPMAAPAAVPPAAPAPSVATAPVAPTAPTAPPPIAPRPEPAFLPPPPVRMPSPSQQPSPPVAAVAPAAPVPAAPVAAAPATTAPVATAPAAPARLPTRDELPDDLKRGLPALAVGGHMYSENADRRMLILDGRLLREGEALANGLVLEQIRARSAVLSVQGARFELKF